jgi:chromosome segregation ATPase
MSTPDPALVSSLTQLVLQSLGLDGAGAPEQTVAAATLSQIQAERAALRAEMDALQAERAAFREEVTAAAAELGRLREEASQGLAAASSAGLAQIERQAESAAERLDSLRDEAAQHLSEASAGGLSRLEQRLGEASEQLRALRETEAEALTELGHRLQTAGEHLRGELTEGLRRELLDGQAALADQARERVAELHSQTQELIGQAQSLGQRSEGLLRQAADELGERLRGEGERRIFDLDHHRQRAHDELEQERHHLRGQVFNLREAVREVAEQLIAQVPVVGHSLANVVGRLDVAM